MDNYSIKSVTFGGFDKQDVVRYIEQAAQQAADQQKVLQEENDSLRSENDSLRKEADSLRMQLEALTAEHNNTTELLKQEEEKREQLNSRESEIRSQLEALKPLQAELDRLRPDAEAYAQFRERIGGIECEARKRAADLEDATVDQLQKTVDLFRQQYQSLMSTFETAADYVTGELRKVEVNLAQLPRAMDRSGSELNELSTALDKIKEEHQG